MRTGKRKIRDGHAYDHFFKRANGRNIRIKKEALLEDTLKWIKIVVSKTLDQTRSIANHLRSGSVRETCKRIWSFCFHHFQYEKDEERIEQIRTPNRAWMDRHTHKGIDCDCFTVFICSILRNLHIPHLMRITRYDNDQFEHIYPVAFAPDGQEIIIDCVVHSFDYEVPYTAKKDIAMDLEILNGVQDEHYNEFGDRVSFENELPIDAQDLFLDEDMELDGLEGRAERKARQAERKAQRARPKEEKKAERKANRQQFVEDYKNGSLKDKIRTGFHVVNKANPASTLLRAGILAGMKLNLFKVASNLRFAYWTPAEAAQNEMDMAKFNQLQKIRAKLEQIYFRAGGKPESLKKALLSGKGNRNKMVNLNGLGSLVELPADEDSIRTILGDDLYYGELDGFALNGLGEPATIATGAAITAASGAMGIIGGLIKKLGGLFKKGSKAAQKFEIQDNTDNQEEKTRKFSLKNIADKIRTKVQERKERKAGSSGKINDMAADDYSIEPAETGDTMIADEEFMLDDPFEGENETRGAALPNSGKRTLGQWIAENKGLSIGIGVGIVGGTALTIYLIKRAKKIKVTTKKSPSLSGTPKPKKKKTKTKTSPAKRKFVPKSRGMKKRKPTTNQLGIEPIM